ncbi:unnamed protein product [Blepharisma stoltei]|uniref:Uncharacterized protein n=1 Tax=Blepharisma stoltei TaxID=1481888 RepID=A0AAU9IFZ6_9CILI|nr:unnamed protein product [Blepharisma stoltei]
MPYRDLNLKIPLSIDVSDLEKINKNWRALKSYIAKGVHWKIYLIELQKIDKLFMGKIGSAILKLREKWKII